MTFIGKLKNRIQQLRHEILALWFAARDPQTPWYAKALALLVTAYAFSPIDLIPDFIPIIGYLDDLVLIPAGISLCIKLIPSEVMQRCREKADLETQKPVSIIGGVIIGLLWLIILFIIFRALYPLILPKAQSSVKLK